MAIIVKRYRHAYPAHMHVYWMLRRGEYRYYVGWANGWFTVERAI